jgi:hypothetical protein
MPFRDQGEDVRAVEEGILKKLDLTGVSYDPVASSCE